jgi:hypothetical protein
MFITRKRHEIALAELRGAQFIHNSETAARITSAAQQADRTNAALRDTQRALTIAETQRDANVEMVGHWRTLAIDAVRALTELQTRYAPAAPIAGDVEQPLSVDAADRKTAQETRGDA